MTAPPSRSNRNLRAGLALLSAATAFGILFAIGCGDENLVFPGGTRTPTGSPAATSVPTDTPEVTGTPTETPSETPSVTETPASTATVPSGPTPTPICAQGGRPCSTFVPCCSPGVCIPFMPPLSICLG